MSARIVGEVWDVVVKGGERLVLLALADHADHEGRNAYPSVDLLAYKTDLSTRQVQRLLRDLVSARIILPSSSTRGGRGHAVAYDIHLENAPRKKARVRRMDREGALPGADIWPDLHVTCPPQGVTGDAQTLPFDEIKGDILSSSDSERVTFPHVKGDIFEIKGDILAPSSCERVDARVGEPQKNLRESNTESATKSPSARARVRAVPVSENPPTVEDVADTLRMSELCAVDDVRRHAEDFHDNYASNGWKVGRNPMVDWPASLRKWVRNAPQFEQTPRSGKPPGLPPGAAPITAILSEILAAVKTHSRGGRAYLDPNTMRQVIERPPDPNWSCSALKSAVDAMGGWQKLREKIVTSDQPDSTWKIPLERYYLAALRAEPVTK